MARGYEALVDALATWTSPKSESAMKAPRRRKPYAVEELLTQVRVARNSEES